MKVQNRRCLFSRVFNWLCILVPYPVPDCPFHNFRAWETVDQQILWIQERQSSKVLKVSVVSASFAVDVWCLKPQNAISGDFYFVQNCWSTDFQALKLRNVWSGRSDSPSRNEVRQIPFLVFRSKDIPQPSAVFAFSLQTDNPTDLFTIWEPLNPWINILYAKLSIDGY